MRVALCLMLAGPAAADQPMTSAEFQAYVGRDTLTYGYSDGSVGRAEYLAEETVRWQYDGEASCEVGTWKQDGDLLCFMFPSQNGPACWRFVLTAGGLYGTGAGRRTEGYRIFQINRSQHPLTCAVPGV